MPRIKDASIFSDFGKLIKVTVIYSVIYCHRREYFFFYHKHFYRNKKNNKKNPQKKGRFFLLSIFYFTDTRPLLGLFCRVINLIELKLQNFFFRIT